MIALLLTHGRSHETDIHAEAFRLLHDTVVACRGARKSGSRNAKREEGVDLERSLYVDADAASHPDRVIDLLGDVTALMIMARQHECSLDAVLTVYTPHYVLWHEGPDRPNGMLFVAVCRMLRHGGVLVVSLPSAVADGERSTDFMARRARRTVMKKLLAERRMPRSEAMLLSVAAYFYTGRATVYLADAVVRKCRTYLKQAEAAHGRDFVCWLRAIARQAYKEAWRERACAIAARMARAGKTSGHTLSVVRVDTVSWEHDDDDLLLDAHFVFRKDHTHTVTT